MTRWAAGLACFYGTQPHKQMRLATSSGLALIRQALAERLIELAAAADNMNGVGGPGSVSPA